jgi:hypothetical protein
MTIHSKKYRSIIILIVFIITGFTGCSGAIRSDAIKQLIEKEKVGLGRINEGLRVQEGKIKQAIDNLKESQKGYLQNLRVWERELKRAQIFATSPGNLKNQLIRKSVFVQLAQLEIDRSDAYEKVQQDFTAQADGLKDAYKKIVTASSKTQDQLKLIDDYVHESKLTFAADTINIEAIKEALSEYKEGQELLQKVADAGESLGKVLTYAKISDRSENMKEFMETLSLISLRMKELKPAEEAQK